MRVNDNNNNNNNNNNNERRWNIVRFMPCRANLVPNNLRSYPPSLYLDFFSFSLSKKKNASFLVRRNFSRSAEQG